MAENYMFRQDEKKESNINVWFYLTIALAASLLVFGIGTVGYLIGKRSEQNIKTAESSRQPSASPGRTAEYVAVSEEFKDKATRANDALGRLPYMKGLYERESNWDGLLLDAEKALDEAKYKAKTTEEKEVLELLQSLKFFIAMAHMTSVLEPSHKTYFDGMLQCQTEVRANLQSVSAKGKAVADKKLCLILADKATKVK